MLFRSPPLVDRSRFTNWKASMKSYVCSSSMEVWRIINKGYYPKDENNLSSSDLIEKLNPHAMHMLEKAMANEGVQHIHSFPNAKEAWDYLLDMYGGNVAIKRSKRTTMQRQVDNFILKDGESPEDVHRRLKVLMVDMKDCGFKDCDDDWFKEKFLQTMVPYNENMVMNVQARADYLDLSPNDVLSIFVEMK